MRTPRALITLAFLLSACSLSASHTRVTAAPSNTLTIGMSGDVETLDPAFTVSQNSNEVIRNLGDQWFHYGYVPRNGVPTYDPTKIVGAAIDSWKVAPNGLSIDLHVRAGMKFHRTGNPVTADDVIYWFNRARGTNAGPAQNMRLAKIKDWKKTGPLSVHIDFTAPSPFFFYEFLDQASALLDSKDIRAHAAAGDPWGTKYVAKTDVFSGPYQIGTYTPGVEMDLAAFPGYWAPQPYFQTVILKFLPTEATRVLLLQQGAIDLAEGLSVDSLNRLQSAAGVKVLSLPDRNQMMMGLNTTAPPFDKLANRQALAYAVPYDDVIANIFQGQALKSQGVIPVLGLDHDSSTWPYRYDPAKAKQLLAAAGNPGGYSFAVHIEQGDDTSNKLAVYLQTRLRAVGINLGIQVDSPANFGFQSNLKFQAWMRELLWYVDDPGYIGSYLGASTTCCFKTGFSTPQLDSIITRLQSLTNSAADAPLKKKLATEYQQIYNAASPIIFLGDLNFKIAMRSSLQGYYKSANDQLWYYPMKRA